MTAYAAKFEIVFDATSHLAGADAPLFSPWLHVWRRVNSRASLAPRGTVGPARVAALWGFHQRIAKHVRSRRAVECGQLDEIDRDIAVGDGGWRK